MDRLIIGDSGLDLNSDLEKKLNIELVPFFIDIEDQHFIDDGSIDVDAYLDAMKASKNTPKTAAPSPDFFYKAMAKADEAFAVTISSKLSTTYSNALIAKKMLEESYPEKKVHVFDSLSAVAGETLVAMKIQEKVNENKPFEAIVQEVEAFIKDMTTLFVLESLDNLIKNGRITKIVGKIASVLSINPVCLGENGEINMKYKVRGMKNAINKLVSTIGESAENLSEKILVISHVKNPLRAENLKEKIEGIYRFKDIVITEAKGLSATYANRGGIVLAF
ncbi:DegV family protein [Peptoniphilaceae bacterium SGI.131]